MLAPQYVIVGLVSTQLRAVLPIPPERLVNRRKDLEHVDERVGSITTHFGVVPTVA